MSSEQTFFEYRHTSPASPERIFPLLCPVREHDWLADWRAEVVHSQSGVAELGCVFVTPSRAARDPVTWIYHHHEPPTHVGITLFLPEVFVELLDVRLRPVGDATEMQWTRRTTALSPAGRNAVRNRAGHFDAKHGALQKALDHYLTTGQCLPLSE